MLQTAFDDRKLSHRPATDGDIAESWLSGFEEALHAGNRAGLEALFAADSHWRDLVAFTWSVTPINGRAAIVGTLLDVQPGIQAGSFAVAKGHKAPRRVKRTGREVIETIFRFDTAAGRGLGILRLPVEDPERAWVVSTSLRELKGHEEPVEGRRPVGTETRIFGGEAWGVRRARETAYENREPGVLVVGGGHNGLALAARLRMLGLDALVVERSLRVGDVWRNRYAALALHNEIELNHMPYLPFPASWPKYLPKDMLGDWMEAYARAMQLNVWTGTGFIDARFDDVAGRWNARVRRADGSERELHPRHLVFANGIVGEPNLPDVPGLKDFEGQILHAQGFDSGAPWRGKKVLVLGVGNSAHDIAQDLHGHGAQVKMIQRGSIAVFSVKSASLNHSVHYDEGLSIDDADLVISSNTFPVVLKGYQSATTRMLENDKALLVGLDRIGFKLDIGPARGGHQMHVRKNHGGYYLNVGASDLLVSGEIGLLHYEDIEHFVPDGALMKDGHVEKAELVVAATGYQPPADVVRALLGEEIAERIGPVWGMDQGGEMANMYKPTPQKGLWFIGGGFAQARIWSHYVALQIKAREAGIVPYELVGARPVMDTTIGSPVPYRDLEIVAAAPGEATGADAL